MKEHPRIDAILDELGGGAETIRAAFILKLGCFSLIPFKLGDPSSRYPITELEKRQAELEKQPDWEKTVHQRIVKAAEEIVKALKEHPNVFAIKEHPEKAPRVGTMYMDSPGAPGAILTSDAFSAHVDLPLRLQKYGDDEHGAKSVEHFDVVSRGSLFVAFAEVDDCPLRSSFAQEYRELASEQVTKKTGFTYDPVPPTPFRPDVYLLFAEPTGGGEDPKVSKYAYRDDILLVVQDRSANPLDWAFRILDNLEFGLGEYYGLGMLDVQLTKYMVEIENHFSAMSEAMKALFSCPWYRVRKASRLSREATTSLTSIRERLVEFETYVFAFHRHRKRFLDVLKEQSILSLIHKVLEDDTELEAQIPNALHGALGHFEEELRTFKHRRTIAIAGILGALVSAVATLLARFVAGL